MSVACVPNFVCRGCRCTPQVSSSTARDLFEVSHGHGEAAAGETIRQVLEDSRTAQAFGVTAGDPDRQWDHRQADGQVQANPQQAEFAVNPDAESASPELPAFLARPVGAPVCHGFPLIEETLTDGWCFGAITELAQPDGCARGDRFVVAPDGSRAGLIWSVGDFPIEPSLPPEPGRWGVWCVPTSVRHDICAIDSARQSDRAGNRKPHFDRYCALILLFLLNPVLRSFRALQHDVGTSLNRLNGRAVLLDLQNLRGPSLGVVARLPRSAGESGPPAGAAEVGRSAAGPAGSSAGMGR